MSKAIKKIISTSNAIKPVGPYSQAVVLDKTVYVSGVLGIDKETSKLVEGGTIPQARQALKWLGVILEASGSSYDNIVKTQIFLNNINDLGAVNEVYKEFFKGDYPARSSFQVGKLPLGADIEIEAVAAVGEVTTISAKM
ncbi:rutC family protein UK114-like [Onthophagus taurus]|uniref:rutC family protein UK114-like n=1 Tax=Onthophagus taurus TaxID=166361 RepID=UPI000C209627|nr:rutC family protein UK114-like [Onthophagus taurus]